MLREKQADAAQRGSQESKESEGFHYAGEPTVVYQDAAVSSASRARRNSSAPNSQRR